MPIAQKARYLIETDWGLTGDFSGDHDNVTPDVDAEAGVTITRGRDQARGRGGSRVASSNHTLNNASQDYSAEFPGSPLSGQLLPGRPHRISSVYGSPVLMDDPDIRMDDPQTLMDGEATVRMFTGKLDELEQQPALGQRRVHVTALGSMTKLRGVRISTAMMLSATTGACLVAAFQAGGLAADEYDVDQDMIDNGRILSYWYADDEDLWDVTYRLVFDTEGYPAAAYERGNGVIAVEGRNYRTLTTRCQVVQATYFDVVTSEGDIEMDSSAVLMEDTNVFMDGLGGGVFHTGLRYTPGFRDVVNTATQEVVLRVAQTSGEVWAAGQTLTLDASGAASITAKPNDPFVTAITPVVVTDFTLSGGVVTVALSRTSGGSTTISFTGGTPGATISALRLRAQTFTATSTIRVTSQIDAAFSVQAYGVRSAQLNGYPGLATAQAESLVDGVVLAYQAPRPLIEIDLVNANGQHLNEQMQREVSDRVHVVERHTGVDIDVMIEQITHTIGVGRSQKTTFSCEKVVEADWALYDVDLYGLGIYGQ